MLQAQPNSTMIAAGEETHLCAIPEFKGVMPKRIAQTLIISLVILSAGMAQAALLGLTNPFPTPQPWVKAELLTVNYSYTTSTTTPDMTVTGDAITGGTSSYMKNGVSATFATKGHFT